MIIIFFLSNHARKKKKMEPVFYLTHLHSIIVYTFQILGGYCAVLGVFDGFARTVKNDGIHLATANGSPSECADGAPRSLEVTFKCDPDVAYPENGNWSVTNPSGTCAYYYELTCQCVRADANHQSHRKKSAVLSLMVFPMISRL